MDKTTAPASLDAAAARSPMTTARSRRPGGTLLHRTSRVPRATYIVALYVCSEIAIRLLRLDRAARLFSVSLAPSSTGEATLSRGNLVSCLSHKEIADIGLVRRIGMHWPSPAGPCLRQALVAGHFLRRHDPALVIGARLGARSAPIAHAWLCLADGTQIGDLDGYSALRHTRRDAS